MHSSKRQSIQVVSKTIIQIIVTKDNIYCIESHHSIPSIQIPKYLFPPLDYQSFKPFIVSYIPLNSFTFEDTFNQIDSTNKIDITTDFSIQILQPEEIKQMWYDYNLVKDIGTIKYLTSEITSEDKIDSNSNVNKDLEADFKLFTLRYHYCPNYKKPDDNHDRVLYGTFSDISKNSIFTDSSKLNTSDKLNSPNHTKLSKDSFTYYWLPYEFNQKMI